MLTVVADCLPFPVPVLRAESLVAQGPKQSIDPNISSCRCQSRTWRYRATKLDLLRSTLQLEPTLLLIPKLELVEGKFTSWLTCES
jgi:hypothetical protein